MTTDGMKWICCQLGAREHYAIPRALVRLGMLDYLLTDAWVRPSSLLAKRAPKLGERFHNELSDAPVTAFNSSLIAFETLARARGLRMWSSLLARNRWFQRKVVSFLDSQPSTLNSVKERGSHGALRSQLSTTGFFSTQPLPQAACRAHPRCRRRLDRGPARHAASTAFRLRE